MNEPTRITLRLLGVLLLALGVVMLVALVFPGPKGIANWMGSSCGHETNGPSEQCTVFDVLELLFVAPMLIFAGGILAAALRPDSAKPLTIDLSRPRS